MLACCVACCALLTPVWHSQCVCVRVHIFRCRIYAEYITNVARQMRRKHAVNCSGLALYCHYCFRRRIADAVKAEPERISTLLWDQSGVRTED